MIFFFDLRKDVLGNNFDKFPVKKYIFNKISSHIYTLNEFSRNLEDKYIQDIKY